MSKIEIEVPEGKIAKVNKQSDESVRLEMD